MTLESKFCPYKILPQNQKPIINSNFNCWFNGSDSRNSKNSFDNWRNDCCWNHAVRMNHAVVMMYYILKGSALVDLGVLYMYSFTLRWISSQGWVCPCLWSNSYICISKCSFFVYLFNLYLFPYKQVKSAKANSEYEYDKDYIYIFKWKTKSKKWKISFSERIKSEVVIMWLTYLSVNIDNYGSHTSITMFLLIYDHFPRHIKIMVWGLTGTVFPHGEKVPF